MASRIRSAMLDQLKAIIKVLRKGFGVAQTLGCVPLAAVKMNDAADTAHDSKQFSETRGNPAGSMVRCSAARYRPLAALVASLTHFRVTYLR